AVGHILYLSDINNFSIRRLDIDSLDVTTFVGRPNLINQVDGPAATAVFGGPTGMVIVGNTAYVADRTAVRAVNLQTGDVTDFAGMLTVGGASDDMGVAAKFEMLADIATDGDNLYVIDGAARTVRKIVIATAEVTTIAGTAFAPSSWS